MTTVNIYLNFDGNCAEAFDFYKSVFGGEFPYVSRFKDMPPHDGMPQLDPQLADKIMHISLPISKETILMGSDKGGEWVPELTIGNNFSICVTPYSKAEAERVFTELSKNGKITMPLDITFWGDYFGMFVDKFGINWMISYNVKNKENE